MTDDNIVIACRSCNGRKRNRKPEDAGMVLQPPPLERRGSGYESRSDQDVNLRRISDSTGQDRTGSVPFTEKGPGEKPFVQDDLEMRAGRFVERFAELFYEHRKGAKYLSQPNLDWQRACRLLAVWDEQRLEKLAVLLLTTNHEWIAGTDRNIRILEAKASFLDDRLREWEQAHGVAV